MTDVLVDGNTDFTGGQNAAVVPDRLSANMFAAGVNVSVQKGVLQPRWGFDKRGITWPIGTLLNPYRRQRTYQNLFESGKFQAAAPYLIGSQGYCVVVISGLIFVWNIDTGVLVYVPIQGGGMINSRSSRVTWAAAGQYLILFDYPADPVIVDGFTARRANPAALEIPVSAIGAYNQNRLFVANGSIGFTGGDPVGSLAAPNAPLTFREVFTTGSPYYGQEFQVPTTDHNEPITFMGFLQFTDSSTGVGPLIIATERSIYSYPTQNPRSSWEGGQFGSLFCYNAGVVGPRAFANINSDAFFLAADGYARSLSMSRDSQQMWARIPISKEAENWFKYWDKSLAKFAVVGAFNNKVFFSVNPYRLQVTDYESLWPINDYAHGGLVVMELDHLSSFGQPAQPAWAGLWTGVNPMDMVTIKNRAFVFSKDAGINTIYEVNPDINYDRADDKIRYVRSRVYTKEYAFEDSFLNKKLHSLDLNLESIQGDLSMKVEYKPAHSACFLPWIDFKHKAPWRTCGIPESCFFNGYAPHQIRDLTFGAPDGEDEANPVTEDLYQIFKKVQLRFTMAAKYWELHELRVKATPKPQQVNATVTGELPVVAVCECCNDDWQVGSFGGCESTVT